MRNRQLQKTKSMEVGFKFKQFQTLALWQKVNNTYLVECGEIRGTILVDVFWLIAKDFPHEVVEDVGELSWDRELLNILAGHLCFTFLLSQTKLKI